MRATASTAEQSPAPPPQPTPGDRLRAARLTRRLSQLQLAVEAGVSIQTISLAERGAAMTLRTAVRLATVLGLNPAELVR